MPIINAIREEHLRYDCPGVLGKSPEVTPAIHCAHFKASSKMISRAVCGYSGAKGARVYLDILKVPTSASNTVIIHGCREGFSKAYRISGSVSPMIACSRAIKRCTDATVFISVYEGRARRRPEGRRGLCLTFRDEGYIRYCKSTRRISTRRRRHSSRAGRIYARTGNQRAHRQFPHFAGPEDIRQDGMRGRQ